MRAAHDRWFEFTRQGTSADFLGTRMGDRDVARRSFLKQKFSRLNLGFMMEARTHHAIEQGVGNGDNDHALVVGHIGTHNCLELSIRQTRRRKVDRLVEPITSTCAPGGPAA